MTDVTPHNVMTNQPLVTIVTPSLNQGAFLEDALVSVANQTYPRIEHLVIDGGSTDHTLDLLRRYESKYALRWYSEPDTGQSDAVNKGFALAQGDIIGWLNADDVYFAQDAIEAVVNTFAEFPHASVVYGDLAFVSRAGTVFRIAPAMPQVTLARLRYHSISQPAVFFRRRIVQEYPLRLDLHYLLDYEYWLRLCSREVFVHLKKIVAAYRVHPGTKTFGPAHRTHTEWHKVWQEYFGIGREPTGLVGVLTTRLMALRIRLRGFGRLAEVYHAQLAFPGLLPSRFWLGIQQLLMPIGVYAGGRWCGCRSVR